MGANQFIRFDDDGHDSQHAFVQRFIHRIRQSRIYKMICNLQLNPLENKVRDQIGPEFGFDLRHMNDHYAYFREIRSKYEILSRGNFLPLHVKPMALRVVAFCRYLKNELFIVVASFESEPCVVSLSLDELLIPMNLSNESKSKSEDSIENEDGVKRESDDSSDHERMSKSRVEELDGLWVVHYIRENTSCMVCSSCILCVILVVEHKRNQIARSSLFLSAL